jgi:hypothetical protein
MPWSTASNARVRAMAVPERVALRANEADPPSFTNIKNSVPTMSAQTRSAAGSQITSAATLNNGAQPQLADDRQTAPNRNGMKGLAVVGVGLLALILYMRSQ